jgi:hypothetical protein
MRAYQPNTKDIEKLLEKDNFLVLLRKTTPEEIESASGTGKRTLERLYNEYSDEIEKINGSAFLYNSISQHDSRMQKFGACQRI